MKEATETQRTRIHSGMACQEQIADADDGNAIEHEQIKDLHRNRDRWGRVHRYIIYIRLTSCFVIAAASAQIKSHIIPTKICETPIKSMAFHNDITFHSHRWAGLGWGAAAVVFVQNKLNWPQKTLPFHPLEPANNNKQHRQKSVFYIINLSVECVYPKICPSISRTSERKKLRKFPENVVHTLWGMRVTIYLWNSLSTLYPFFSVRFGAYFPLCKTSTAQ